MRGMAWMAVAAVVAAGGLILPRAASAEDDLAAGAGYGSDNLSFERWCSEIQRYPADRCGAKSEADVTSYNDAKIRIQKFEVDHAKDQRQEREFRRDFDSHSDRKPTNNL